MSVTTTQATDALTALRRSHDRLTSLVRDLDAASLEGPSYDTGWSIAQVLSHLGSAAEIFLLSFSAGLDGTEVPGDEDRQAIWDTWNAKGPLECRDDSATSNEALVARIEALSPERAETYRVSLFGMDLDLAGFVRMRLAEHAVHAWDIAVALDPTETVAADAVALLVGSLGTVAGWSGKPSLEPYSVLIETEAPTNAYVVSVGESVSFDVAADDEPSAVDGTVAMPAEALLRLVYGRLDADHTPPLVESGQRGVGDLRLVFPGF